MGGHQSTNFIVKMSMIGTFLTVGGLYLFSRYRSKALLGAITIGLACLLIFVFLHPPLTWFGDSPALWRAFAAGLMLIGTWRLRRVLTR